VKRDGGESFSVFGERKLKRFLRIPFIFGLIVYEVNSFES
jgi:hypothetical protein